MIFVDYKEFVCIVIPTYNEKDNVGQLIDNLQQEWKKSEFRSKKIKILIIDDNSPDGTAEVVKKKISEHSNIHLIIRKDKRGLGSAYKTGFNFALNKINPKIIIEMDSDLSHNPKYIP